MSDNTEATNYELLQAITALEVDKSTLRGQSSSALKKTFKKQYYKLSKKYHPDKNKNNPSATEKFKEINNANQLLQEKCDFIEHNLESILNATESKAEPEEYMPSYHSSGTKNDYQQNAYSNTQWNNYSSSYYEKPFHESFFNQSNPWQEASYQDDWCPPKQNRQYTNHYPFDDTNFSAQQEKKRSSYSEQDDHHSDAHYYAQESTDRKDYEDEYNAQYKHDNDFNNKLVNTVISTALSVATAIFKKAKSWFGILSDIVIYGRNRNEQEQDYDYEAKTETKPNAKHDNDSSKTQTEADEFDDYDDNTYERDQYHYYTYYPAYHADTSYCPETDDTDDFHQENNYSQDNSSGFSSSFSYDNRNEHNIPEQNTFFSSYGNKYETPYDQFCDFFSTMDIQCDDMEIDETDASSCDPMKVDAADDFFMNNRHSFSSHSTGLFSAYQQYCDFNRQAPFFNNSFMRAESSFSYQRTCSVF